MAITIVSTPQAYTPSDNDVKWEFTSTNTGQANFSFYVEVFVGNVLRGAHLIFPERGNKAHYDASSDTLLYTPKPTIPTSFSANMSNAVPVRIEITERFGTPPVLVGASKVVATSVVAWKARVTDEQWIAFLATDYIFGANKKMLTYFPRDEKFYCGMSENAFFAFISNAQTTPEVIVTLYDSTGTPIATDAVSCPASVRTIIFNANPTTIIAASTLTLGDFNNAEYYTIKPSDGVSVVMEEFKIYINRECNPYGSFRLHFMNKLGGMDSFTFNKANTINREVKSHGFEKQFGGWDANSNYTYSLQEGREQQYIKTSTGRMTISSDWLNEEIQNWLVDELYESTFVLMEVKGQLRRVNVLNGGFVVRQDITDQLFQEIVELNLSDARKSATT